MVSLNSVRPNDRNDTKFVHRNPAGEISTFGGVSLIGGHIWRRRSARMRTGQYYIGATRLEEPSQSLWCLRYLHRANGRLKPLMSATEAAILIASECRGCIKFILCGIPSFVAQSFGYNTGVDL